MPKKRSLESAGLSDAEYSNYSQDAQKKRAETKKFSGLSLS